MGVFIISPADKGGRLYNPPAKLVDLCKPLTPIQFNNLYCLQRNDVHTLSIGAARPTDFDEHAAGLAYYERRSEVVPPVEALLNETMESVLGRDWLQSWFEGIPEVYDIPQEVNILEILRIWNYASSLDLVDWGRSRYNMFGEADHWFPGKNPTQAPNVDLAEVLANSPWRDRILDTLPKAHQLLGGEAVKRLSQS
jgi:predicted aldo/keto reductase-like oxidoreductase